MKKALIVCVAMLSLISCSRADAVKLEDSNARVNGSPVPQKQLSEIKLAAIGRIAPKGRVQDREHNKLPVIDQLLAHGKESIPYLISQLDDETKIEGHVQSHWYHVTVGDVALSILTSFFTDSSWERTTIPGLGWNEFLGGGDDPNLTGEERLRNYIDLRGRKSIKERWQQVWEKHKDHIYWNEEERCFVSTNTN